jgi:hypothetical protein
MKRKILQGLLLISIFVLTVSIRQPVWAETLPAVDAASLIERAKELNGSEVQYSGEVIGDIMARGDHYWINVLDHGTAIGVWITASQRELIEKVGRYGSIGDQVTVVGQFNRACSQHGGDLDIHATTLVVNQTGYTIEQTVSGSRLLVAMIILVAALASLFILVLPKIHSKNSLLSKPVAPKPK